VPERCKQRSRAAGQPLPCRESRISPGTCVWCFCRIETGELDTAARELAAKLDATAAPAHPSDLRGMRFRP